VKLTAALLLTGSILALPFASARGEDAKPNDDFHLVKVGDGVYAAVANPGGLASGNAGFIIGDDGAAVIDTFFTPVACEELIAAVGTETPRPIRFAVDTHDHLDHTGGNQVFAARNVPIFAHDNVMEWQTTKNLRFLPSAADLQKRRADAEAKLTATPREKTDDRAAIERQIRRLDAMLSIHLTNPTVTFGSGEVHLHLGKREVRLFTLPGHTGGDVLAYVPDADVLFTGDLVWRKTLPNLIDATVADWIKTLDLLLDRYPNAKFVAGHGEPGNAADVREFRGYLENLRDRVQKAIADGLTLDQAKEQLTLPDAYKDFAIQSFAKPNIESMYKELKGTK
jgi:cyclase